LNPTLQTLLDEFIIPHVRDLNFTLREAAVKALGCACLKSIKMAKRSLMVVLSVNHVLPLLHIFNSVKGKEGKEYS